MEEASMLRTVILPALSAVLAFGLVAAAAAQTNPVVEIKTSQGDITIELDPVKAPVTVQNFLSYVDEKFYDGTIFHRIIKGFMIQGGGLTPDYKEKKEKAPIKNESGNGLSNRRGTIAMARGESLSSATCQFYINHADNLSLDGMKYAVFGRVIKGMDVVDAIAAVPTGIVKGYEDAPRQPITIQSIRRADAK
jgi:cyclophilin family peptidyl-prolyl cis-trans isomerase